MAKHSHIYQVGKGVVAGSTAGILGAIMIYPYRVLSGIYPSSSSGEIPSPSKSLLIGMAVGAIAGGAVMAIKELYNADQEEAKHELRR